MRLDHLLSKETSNKAMTLFVTSYRSVQSVRPFNIIQFRGYRENVLTKMEKIYGGLAQLGERLPCKQEVSGSIPLISTTSYKG